MCSKEDSIWWRDIINNDLIDKLVVNRFTGCYNCCCKNGKNTLFWHNLWLGDQSLRELYPKLFDMSTIQNYAVADLLVMNNGRHKWALELLFSRSDGPAAVVAGVLDSVGWSRLCSEMDAVRLYASENDDFLWCTNSENEFSVACISNIVSVSKSFAWAPNVIKLLKVMWNLIIPPKMKVFAQRFLVERIPSKDLLLKRAMANLNIMDCVFCGTHTENLSHLFFNCQVVKEIWKSMYGWLGILEDINGEEFLDFGLIQEKVKNANHRVKINIIWIATIWRIWLMRNAINFEGESFCNIIFFSWRRLSNGNHKFKSIYYEWFKFPLSCSNTL
ncbi:uncharacterized protein LOC131614002 [Vicia villosa]|uniref:uncharacterized protein LOC131614002 n=1 Tax=Vicia villosa TaxID=3911 RepID=UPI00273BB074|nr:uncharacterized protein LOC131614002 [Vicia villosa]